MNLDVKVILINLLLFLTITTTNCEDGKCQPDMKNAHLTLKECTKSKFPLIKDPKWVQQLSLINTGIEAITQEDLQDLTNLHVLEMIDNKLMHIANESFWHLDDLVQLNIQEDRLQLDDLALPAKLSNIRLKVNAIESDLFDKLIETLTNVSLNNTVIKGLKFIEIPNTNSNLLDLTIRNCSIDGFTARTESILHLDLSHNLMTSLRNDLGKLWRTISLNLAHNRIVYITSNDFYSMTSLKELKLNHNQIEFVDANAFEQNVELHTVDLSNNRLLKIQLNYNQQKYLIDVMQNPLICDQLEKLSDLSYFKKTKAPAIGMALANGVECTLQIQSSLGRGWKIYFYLLPVHMMLIIALIVMGAHKYKYRYILKPHQLPNNQHSTQVYNPPEQPINRYMEENAWD